MMILFSWITGLKAQQTGVLKGRVFDETNQPAARATISVHGTEVFTVAGADGTYILKLQPGKHTLICSMVGFRRQELEVSIPAGGTVEHDFTLKKAENHHLKEITIAGSPRKRQIETSGFAANVIETKEAALRNIQTNELLDRTVGVRVRQNGGLGSNVEYNLNGMTGRAVGVFIDGIEISTYGSSFNLNTLPPSMIERIEVYKGVLPSQLSGDYMGGAINVVLKKDISHNNITASVSYGSFNTFQADASGTYRNNKNGFTFKASGFYTYTDNDYETWGKFSKYIAPNGVVTRNFRARRFNDSYRSAGGRFETGFTNVKWADIFLLGYNISDTYNEIPHGQTMGRPYVGRFNEAQAHVLSLNYVKKNILVESLNFSVNAVYSNRDTYLQDTSGAVYNWDGKPRLDINNNPMYNVNEGQQGQKVITDINRKILNVRSNLSYDLFSGHRLSFNHVYYTVDRNDADLLRPVNNAALKTKSDLSKNVWALNYEAQALSNKLRTNLFGKLYQQNIGRLTPTVTVVDGKNIIRMDKVDTKVNATGFGFAASYEIVPHITLISSAERAVRMPGESEILGDPSDNILSNFSIKPEVSNNYNIGFRLGAFDFNQHKLTLSANAFSRNVKDKIMRQANTNLSAQEIEVSPFVNLGKAQSLGFEAELLYTYRNKLNAVFSFSKFNSLLKGSAAAADRLSPFYNKQVPNEPFFTMNANVQYRLNNLIQNKSIVNLFYSFGYVAPFNTIWPESEWFTTNTQLVHDLGINYRFPNKKLILSVDAKNIFNSEVYDNFGVQKPGRAFYGKVTYTLGKI